MKASTWFWQWFYVGIALGLLALIGLTGCAVTQPISQGEMFPLQPREQDPTIGLIIVEGSAAFKAHVFDEKNNQVAIVSERGANPHVTYNGRTALRIYRSDQLDLRLPAGRYRIEAQPFYYLSVALGVTRIPQYLPRQTYSFVVGPPDGCYDYEFSRRYWGWCLRMNIGDTPRDTIYNQVPGVDIGGTGIIGDFLEWLRRR